MKNANGRHSISQEQDEKLYRYWFKNPMECEFASEEKFDGSAQNNFINTYLPHTKHYFSEVTSLFSFELEYYDTRSKGTQTILLRDGFYSLMWFLYNHKPSKIPHHFLIHSKFMPFIPNNWLDKVGFYSYYAANKRKANKLLVTGIFVGDSLEPEDSDRLIKQLKKKMKPRLKEKHVFELALSVRDNFSGGLKNYLYFVNKFEKEIGPVAKHWSDKEVGESKKFSNHLVYPLNSYKIMADDFYPHLLCHFGAQYLPDEESNPLNISNDYEDIDLSPTHGIRVFRPLAGRVNEEVPMEALALYERMWTHFWYTDVVPWPPDFPEFISKYMDF